MTDQTTNVVLFHILAGTVQISLSILDRVQKRLEARVNDGLLTTIQPITCLNLFMARVNRYFPLLYTQNTSSGSRDL